ncbi:DUF2911 domain-containing protein [Flavobacterium sp. xlx-214]|uniref:DUF2911 domain-containing protein n=1 Tax=unclassified Flavobacterium TaxID=196869 RepID=UPI0013D0DBE4|nr:MULTISPECIES: DUF2911 domain-containing protein [unclassified Flavobacterium]MBA5791624.1 DUF2911 domain-containing protein [Flavobacterium sp. xlx-221]QMI82869.1 DUF2911 domain-containing protein [Flavobacterium sp. xlx-214]
MKKLVLAAAFIFAMNAQAQIKTPQASLKSDIEQTVGLTKVDVEYYRPAKKGRLVFGDLVPYGKVWRTGANQNTVVEFDTDIEIEGKTLAAGKYALYSIPKAESWDVIFYKTTDNWGLPKTWNESDVVLKTSVKPETLLNDVEYLTIAVNPKNNNEATLDISWEKTLVKVPFKLPTHKLAMESINSSINASSKASDYYAAGVYLFSVNQDLKKALEYVNKSITMQEGEVPFYMLRQKSLIQAANGDKKGAIETANQSLKASEKAGNEDYIKMNRNSILEWSKS